MFTSFSQVQLRAAIAICFSLKYCPGVGNRDAKALSSSPYEPETPSDECSKLTSEGVHVLC